MCTRSLAVVFATSFRARLAVIVASTALAAPCALSSAATVFDNNTTWLGSINVLLPAGATNSPEHGNQITLAGHQRIVTSMAVRVASIGQGVSTFNRRARIYRNDGPGGAPGTLLWDSGEIASFSDSGFPIPYSFIVPNIRVPASFTYSVQITNRQGDQGAIGPAHYGPPTVGSALPGYWRNSGQSAPDWTFIDNNDPAFGAFISAETIPGDVNHTGSVDVNDLLEVITHWGACRSPCPPRCAADVAPPRNGNCTVNVDDLLLVIANWG